MGFRLPKQARTYFKDMVRKGDVRDSAGLNTLFDTYYLCLMVGFRYRSIGQQQQIEDTEFVDNYPAPFTEKREVIAGLLIDAEMERKGIKPEDRESVQELMVEILDFQSPTYLSKRGHSYLDEYAAGGVEIIRDKIPRTPDVPAFLVSYVNLFDAKDSDA